jgi:hypothetical protein
VKSQPSLAFTANRSRQAILCYIQTASENPTRYRNNPWNSELHGLRIVATDAAIGRQKSPGRGRAHAVPGLPKVAAGLFQLIGTSRWPFLLSFDSTAPESAEIDSVAEGRFLSKTRCEM